jgi:hypothetical protein
LTISVDVDKSMEIRNFATGYIDMYTVQQNSSAKNFLSLKLEVM